MYDKLQAYLESKGLKLKAENNIAQVEAVKTEYEAKEKVKALTQAERLDRIEKILGL